MIAGAASEQGTSAYAQSHPALTFEPLGTTRWHVSQAGFGCYRVSAGIEAHKIAMHRAISSGVNLVDTSTNYADGGSEVLVGEVLEQLCRQGTISRQQVVVVSKVGYLQGTNYALSQERKSSGRPFPDLVPYGKELEHCIHPEFIADQLDRSLERLQMETLDVLLLHNPEYYLGWAHQQGLALEEARSEFYRRIAMAFRHLEDEVRRGRIQYYGISSNTFPSVPDDPQFVSLDQVLQVASQLSGDHHFRVIQFPMNVFEPGAALNGNQPNGDTLLGVARRNALGAMVNRPLNAFTGRRLIRLSDIEASELQSDDDIIAAIEAVSQSEADLWGKLVPLLQLSTPLYQRLIEQAAMGMRLKQYWKKFGSHDRWRQFEEGFLWPNMRGVFDFLEPYTEEITDIRDWIDRHRQALEVAAKAIGSLYGVEAVREIRAIKTSITAADSQWNDDDGTVSQLAIRVLRSTSGISSVLVGMRREAYVDDVIEELTRPVSRDMRSAGWRKLDQSLAAISEQGAIA